MTKKEKEYINVHFSCRYYGSPCVPVALLEKNKILAVRSSKEQKNHLKDLMPLIKDLLDSVQIHKSKLNYIAASIGPGSFTGIRIGVATARALAQVLDIPAVAVPTLDAVLL